MGKNRQDLSHLTKESKALLVLTDEERIIHIQADKWIGYPVAKKVMSRLEQHINLPSKQRMPNLLIIGPTNNGKSTIIEQEGADLLSLLASFEAILPLRQRSDIATSEMARYIVARTEGTIGEIATFLEMAAIEAIRTGEERLNTKVFKHTQYQSPTERIRAFERQVQVG